MRKKKVKSNNIIDIIAQKDLFKRYLYLIIGLTLSAATFNLFMLSNEIVAGGVGGIAIIAKNIIDPSLCILVLDVILLIMSYVLLGKEKTASSIIGSLLYPVFVKLTANVGSMIPIQNDDLLLMAVFAGVLSGIASGIIFKNGFTTGGTDILNQIVAKYFKRSIGTSMLLTDGVIVLFGGFFFGWNKVMYSIIILYILSLIADKVILGISDSKAFYIITDKDEAVKKFILENLSHGVTVFDAKGGYSGENNRVLMCIIPAKDYFKLKEGIALIDTDAFFVVADAYEVMGGS